MSIAALSVPCRERRHRDHRPRLNRLRSGRLRRRVRFCLDWLETRTLLATFVVSSTDDSGPGSLRQAILDSNAATTETNRIEFQIPGDGAQTIAPLSDLPAITQAVVIDGFSQPGYAGTPVVELTGYGLVVTGSGVTIRGLAINGYEWGAGVLITGSGATDNWVYGNFLGTDPSGTRAEPNQAGIRIDAGAHHNLVGTDGDGIDDESERNVVSGNSDYGVGILLYDQDYNWVGGTEANIVTGNLIGTDATGTRPLGNSNEGIRLLDHANWIGTSPRPTAAGARLGNVIAGNGSHGIIIGYYRERNVIAGNAIGTDATGSLPLPNRWGGIQVYGTCNTIGGSAAAAGNLIAHNDGPGVVIGNPYEVPFSNSVRSNRIFANGGPAIDLKEDGVTDNAPGPRAGIPNFPIIVATADGRLRGWLGGGLHDTTYAVDYFASADYQPSGAGEAEVFLGSLEVTTDDKGQAAFDVLFTAPPGKPVITATAIDSEGNTSEVSSRRPASIGTPPLFAEVVPGTPLVFSSTFGPGIVVQDPGAGTIDPVWDLTLSVGAGTLTLSSLAGLSGSGNGTGSLSYSGQLSALNAALEGLTYTPPPGSHVLTSLSLAGQSPGVWPVEAQFELVERPFTITTANDDGPGSLRRAILYANAAARPVTITFAIPGTGAWTIALASLLPSVTNSLVIDGTSQPGDPGAPRIVLDATQSGDSIGLTIGGAEVTLSGVVLDGARFLPGSNPGRLVLPSGRLDSSSPGVVRTRIDVAFAGLLSARVQAQGLATRLSLLDSQGHELVRSDRGSLGDLQNRIDEHVPPGMYLLEVEHSAGAGFYTLAATLTAAGSLRGGSPTTDWPQAIAAADFNGDGVPDLATVRWENEGALAVKLGLGDGTFGPPVLYAIGSSTTDIEATDLDGDGRLDLVAANPGSSDLSVLLGRGDGTFQPARSYAAGVGQVPGGQPGPSSVVVGDFDADGVPDLAAFGVFSNIVSVLLGRGDGTFKPQVTYQAWSEPSFYWVAGAQALALSDLNGDGRLDLVAANAATTEVSVLLGDGDGTFQPRGIYPAGASAVGVVLGDFDGDGRIDLVAVEPFGNQSYILLGNGDGSFRTPQPFVTGSNSSAIVAGHFDGDGRLDLASASWNTAGGLYVMMGHGDGTFRPPAPYQSGLRPMSLVMADFDRDGRLDLATANTFSSDVTVLMGNGDGSFRPEPTNGVGSSPVEVVNGDFNGDGRLHLATANERTRDFTVLLGNGDGTFQRQATYPVGSSPSGLVTGDFNRDGRLDLAIASSASRAVSVMLGNGDGAFQLAASYAVGAGAGAIDLGDLDGDGQPDLIVTSTSFEEDCFTSVLLGQGDGTFRPGGSYPAGNTVSGTVLGDLDGDGVLDLATANYYSNSVTIMLGNGDGSFQPPVSFAGGTFPEAVAAGDFNGDGRLDLITVSWSVEWADYADQVAVLLGIGDGTFQPPQGTWVGEATLSVATGDFDGDGRTDVVIGKTRSAVILSGQSDGTFQSPKSFPVGLWAESLTTGDFNGDGRPDVAADNRQSNDVTVLLAGTGPETLVDPGRLAIALHAAPLVTDVNGDGSEDVLVLNAGGDILYRQGNSREPGSFLPPIVVNPGSPARDIAWVSATDQGPMLAAVDASDDTLSFYVFREGDFRPFFTLLTGRLPAQVVSADLDWDGLLDLVVRNAGEGSLSVFWNKRLPELDTGNSPFRPAETVFVGEGVSDVQAADIYGTGRLDLVVTNKISGQVSLLHNLGDGAFAPGVPYRAAAGWSSIVDDSGSLVVASLEETAQVTVGPMPGGRVVLVTANPGSNTIGVLAGLGDGRFANAFSLPTQSRAQVVRMADFDGDGSPDLALLGGAGLTIQLGVGGAAFRPPVRYDVGPDPTGLSVADLDADGILDLLVSNVHGDLLVLLGNGDGTFRPYRKADDAVALAVADLTGDGRPDFVYANQGLDRVLVEFGDERTMVLGDQTSGLLAPGAVQLADLTGDGIADLIVANSGSNNILVYPGLGDGQFGPSANGGNGFFAGTQPTGLAVEDLNGDGVPDLLVANTGSNDVSILLGNGSGADWTLTPGPRIRTDAGPVAVAVENLVGSESPDLVVANQQANTVQIFSGVGGGFFDDQSPTTRAVGQAPRGLFRGNFDGSGTEIATLNAGSDTITLIEPSGTIQTFPAGGLAPSAAFTGDFNSDGLTDLVVGSRGNGAISLFLGGSAGLTLSQSIASAAVPSPTSLSFAGVSDGILSFFATTAGLEAASLLAFSLDPEVTPGAPLVFVNAGETGPQGAGFPGAELSPNTEQSAGSALTAATTGLFQQVAQLLGLGDSTLGLIATLSTVSIIPGGAGDPTGGGGVVLLANFLPDIAPTVSQGSPSDDPNLASGKTEETEGENPPDEATAEKALTLPLTDRIAMAIDRAWEHVRSDVLAKEGHTDENLDRIAARAAAAVGLPHGRRGDNSDWLPLAESSFPVPNAVATALSLAVRAIDAAIQSLVQESSTESKSSLDLTEPQDADSTPTGEDETAALHLDAALGVAFAAYATWAVGVHPRRRRSKGRTAQAGESGR